MNPKKTKSSLKPLSLLAGMIALLWVIQPGAQPKEQSAAPQQADALNARPADQTFLTFPEWFLVFSPEEMAKALEQGQAPSALPWLRHTGQIWSSYWAVSKRVLGKHPFNSEYHVMILVIGVSVSSSIEYGLRGLYEITLGRASEFLFGHGTQEDRLEALEARRYVEFIKEKPWHEFSFVSGLRRLWTLSEEQTPLRAWPRRWERKVKLSAEWGFKALYAWAMAKAAAGAYEARIHKSPVSGTKRGGIPFSMDLPRHQPFTPAALVLAEQGADFKAICGNESSILVSYLASPGALIPDFGQTLLIEQTLPTQKGQTRRAEEFPVAKLAEFLRWASAQPQGQISLEHIFDY